MIHFTGRCSCEMLFETKLKRNKQMRLQNNYKRHRKVIHNRYTLSDVGKRQTTCRNGISFHLTYSCEPIYQNENNNMNHLLTIKLAGAYNYGVQRLI